jgi:large subunit ribosomal protein L23
MPLMNAPELAVEKLYDVKVKEVRTLNRKGKPRRTRTGMSKTAHWKRAVVVLEDDSRIELF